MNNPRRTPVNPTAAEPTRSQAGRSTRPARWRWWAAAAVMVGLLTVYPPFHVVSKSTATAASSNGSAFSAAEFAATFWAEKLQPAAKTAPAANQLLVDVRRDPTAAAKMHGHQVGLGNAAYYFARVTGRVTAIEKSRLLIQVDDAVVAVRTGPVFGNVVRDGCGLLEVNAVPGLQEFNAISAELNRLVEERVQPALKSVPVGTRLEFAGCAEAPESTGHGPLLSFVPVHVEVNP